MFSNFTWIFTSSYVAGVPVGCFTHAKLFIREEKSVDIGLVLFNGGKHFLKHVVLSNPDLFLLSSGKSEACRHAVLALRKTLRAVERGMLNSKLVRRMDLAGAPIKCFAYALGIVL
jgi:hypothetical protein